MDRLYDFNEAKRLCSSHKELLERVDKILSERARDIDQVRDKATKVIDRVSIEQEINNALQKESVSTVLHEDAKAIALAVYKYDVGDTITAALRSIKPTSLDIFSDINNLRAVNSSIRWMFSGKQAKQDANESYRRLSDLLRGEYVEQINDLESRNNVLNNISDEVAIGSLADKGDRYLGLVKNAFPNASVEKYSSMVFIRLTDVKNIINKYRTARLQQTARERDARKAVEDTVQPLIMEKAMQELRNHDIEALLQKRSGIRVKPLRERGYKTVADVYAATPAQLASIHGISADAASVIKDAAREILRDLSKTMKLKISRDEKTSAATSLLRAAYQYERVHKAEDLITKEVTDTIRTVESNAETLSELRNNLYWILATPQKKESYLHAYQMTSVIQHGEVAETIKEYCSAVMGEDNPSEMKLWNDFGSRSIEYLGQ